MKLLALFLLFFFISCRKKENAIISDKKPVANAIQKSTQQYLTDSLVIAGKTYTLLQGYPGRNTLPMRILFNKDTIYKHNNYSSNGFGLKDLEGNGTIDIELNYLSNIGGIKEWVIFDKETGSFREIKKFSEFPGAEKLEGTKYFYSDHKMGCAGGMWGSELFYIDNFEAKAIARIFVITCRDADYTMGVTIYKIEGKNERIMEQMLKVPKKYKDETAFFKDYWLKNYKKFE